jgi:hypothetical protein
MTKEDFNLLLNAITAIGALATAGTFILLYFQLKAMRCALDDSRNWNQMSTAFKIYPNSMALNQIEDELNKSFIKLIDRKEPLSEQEVGQLFEETNMQVRLKLKNYLNEFESYCTAINMGVVHEEVAKRTYCHKITRYYLELKPFIYRLRTIHNEPRLLIELETVASKWLKKDSMNTRY